MIHSDQGFWYIASIASFGFILFSLLLFTQAGPPGFIAILFIGLPVAVIVYGIKEIGEIPLRWEKARKNQQTFIKLLERLNEGIKIKRRKLSLKFIHLLTQRNPGVRLS